MLAKQRSTLGDLSAYQFAGIYAQWGNAAKSHEWLATAVRLRDPGLLWLKTDPFLDPMRNEPWFKAIERELKWRRLTVVDGSASGRSACRKAGARWVLVTLKNET
jgi:hypothetical protein